MSIEERVIAVLKGNTQRTQWESLISLFQADREAFYLLAVSEVDPQAEPWIRELANLATAVRVAVRESYEVEQSANGAKLVSYSGRTTPIPSGLVKQVTGFLREVDGKTTATAPGKDYEGTAISEAEAAFKLGDNESGQREHQKLATERAARPLVLRLSEDDIQHLTAEPAFVTYELLECARKSVLAPTYVFQGLQRGDHSWPKANNGWAFCGMPRHAFTKDGKRVPAPSGMVYVVYADEDGYVFDWNWVKENPGETGCPLHAEMRFGNPQKLDGDAILDLPKSLQPGNFDQSKVSYSSRGDCIFCYMSDDVSYAERINSDLTVCYSLAPDKRLSGFKIKNVRRILQQDKSIILPDAPDLTVSVQGALLATLKGNADTHVEVYEVIIGAFYETGGSGPPKVVVPRHDAEPIGA